jgi:hypothetical protein
VEFFRGLRGAVPIAFEEGTQAQWLHDPQLGLETCAFVRSLKGDTSFL